MDKIDARKLSFEDRLMLSRFHLPVRHGGINARSCIKSLSFSYLYVT